MVWGVDLPSSFGDYFPDGTFAGWEDRLRQYFREEMFRKNQEHFRSDGDYSGQIIEAFIKETGVPRKYDPTLRLPKLHEFPAEFQVQKTYRTLGDLIKTENRILAVSQPLMEIIERLEPGVHMFAPLRIVMPKGVEYPVPYFCMIVCRFLDAFNPEASDPGSVRAVPPFWSAESKKACYAGVAMEAAKIGSSHLWRERKLLRPALCLSDSLQAEIVKAGLRIPKQCQMREV